jgi:hypothetical protein
MRRFHSSDTLFDAIRDDARTAAARENRGRAENRGRVFPNHIRCTSAWHALYP